MRELPDPYQVEIINNRGERRLFTKEQLTTITVYDPLHL